MSNSKEVLELQYPFVFKGNTVSSLEVRRPTVADQLTADKLSGSDAETEIQLFANLCEVEPSLFDGMDLKDYRGIQEIYSSFLS